MQLNQQTPTNLTISLSMKAIDETGGNGNIGWSGSQSFQGVPLGQCQQVAQQAQDDLTQQGQRSLHLISQAQQGQGFLGYGQQPQQQRQQRVA